MRRLAPVFALVAMLAAPASAAGNPTKTDVFATPAAFAHAETAGARYDERLGGFRLQDDAAGYARAGSFTIGNLRYGAFNRAVTSWNADCPTGTWVQVEVGASRDGGKTWTPWLEQARWGDRETLKFLPKSEAKKDEASGTRINEDTFETKEPADRLRVRVTLHTDRPGATPVVSLVSVAVADKTKEVAADDARGPAWGREVTTDFRSQGWEQPDISYRICGPTSTGMALTAVGVKLKTADVADACWDELNGIYGNWPFIAAAASDLMRKNAAAIAVPAGKTRTARSWVAWPSDWKFVEQEVLAGHPCVVSIRFKKGELKNAPISSTDGHLILVKGFTKDGNPIAHDPAAKSAAAGRIVYDRQELHAARHGGPVIVLHPYE